jgi:hypothetical protein
VSVEVGHNDGSSRRASRGLSTLGVDRVEGFELGGRDVAERLVQPVVVEPRDVGDDGELELAAGSPHAIADVSRVRIVCVLVS